MKKTGLILLLCVGLGMQSCIPGETPVPAHDAGDVITASVQLESSYKWQIYYSLESNTQVGRNDKSTWDLGFETAPEGSRIILNMALPMAAYPTNKSNFDAVTIADTVGVILRRDSPSGSLDSTAIGDWATHSTVYIIDRTSKTSNGKRWKKMQVLSADASGYKIRFADIDGTNEQQVNVPKDERYNFSFLSLADGALVQVEPPKDMWDIVFSQYTHIYYHLENTPYTVTGCLLNRHQTAAAIDTTRDFADISYEHIAEYRFSNHVDAIGFNWKWFSLSGDYYEVDPTKIYVIRTASGKYFKLHFIDYVGTNGERGTPTWEFQEL